MKNIHNWLLNFAVMAVLPGVAGAAGTYYNNSVYQRYGAASSGNSNYNSGYNSGTKYSGQYGQKNTSYAGNRNAAQKQNAGRANAKNNSSKNNGKKQGWVFAAGLTHELANWKFDMNSAGSQLHYDNLMWNVIDGQATYYFGDSVPLQAKIGARYGMQFDESPMIDDDISKGGYIVSEWTDGANPPNVLGYQTGHALSVGTSKDGTQMGFNASIGLTDYFKWNGIKMTPSVGYRYLKYKLSTKRNYGVTLDIFEATDQHAYVTCVSGYMGEIQCDPFLVFIGEDGQAVTGRLLQDNGTLTYIIVPSNTLQNILGVDTGGTYYYEQAGTSHEYETTWAGPYVAMDMEYQIDNKNFVSGGIELGLPVYTSEGNQPYRYDWAHPKSVEDSGELGDAYHIGLNAMWKTMITNSAMLTLGFTYDYYTVSNAKATTYLNSGYYMGIYNEDKELYNDEDTTEEEKALLAEEMAAIDAYRAAGWKQETSSEINSLYRSMGIRVGINVKF